LSHLTALELALVALACFAGTLVQGAIGFGFALVAVPTLLLVEPAAVPVTALLLALPLTTTLAVREREALDLRGALEVTVGRLPGTAAGTWVVGVASARTLSAVVGGLLLVAVLVSAGFRADAGRSGRLVAGFASGIMGTIAAVGGPAVALAYQTRPGPEVRATLAVTFVLGLALSFAALAVAGEVAGWQAELALVLLPAVVLGLLASPKLAGRLDGARLRPAILLFAGAAGVAAVLRSLL